MNIKSKKNYRIKLGCQVSLTKKNIFSKKEYLVGSLYEAISYDASAFMLYIGAPQTTRRVEVERYNKKDFLIELKKNKFPISNIVVHAPYIMNLCTYDREKYIFSVNFFIEEIRRAEYLNLKYIIIHPGSYIQGNMIDGLKRLSLALIKAIDETQNIIICIENMSGKGTQTCTDINQFITLFNFIPKKYHSRLGMCLDTCHLHDYGYNLEKDFDGILDLIDKNIGIDKIYVLHINDSKNPIGSKKDRHENLNKGYIKIETLIKILYHPLLLNVIKILETPWLTNKTTPYKEEITLIRNFSLKNNNSEY